MLVQGNTLQRQRPLDTPHCDHPAVQLRQQLVHRDRHEIYHVLLQGILCRQAGALAHGLFRPLGIAAAQLRQALDIGHRVVDDLVFHGGTRRGRLTLGCLVPTARQLRHAPYLHRRGGPQVGTGRHGSDMGGVQQIGARAGGPGAAGRDVAHYRQRRGQHGLDHCAHGQVQPPGRIDAQDYQLGAGGLRLLQATHHMVGAGRADGTAYLHQPCIGPAVARQQQQCHQQQHRQAQNEGRWAFHHWQYH